MNKKILFVCLGNICRSPAADEIFRARVREIGKEDNYEIDSAGTYGGHAGELPDARMRGAAFNRGYKLRHISRPVKPKDFEDFDMIIAMDDSNYENLFRMAGTLEERDKIYRMTDFSSQKEYNYIPDPYYEGQDGFGLVLDLLEDACKGLLEYTEGR